MPSDMHTPEVAPAFGAVDADALTTGHPVSAAVLRELGRSANRLRNRGGFLARIMGDFDQTSPTGVLRGAVTPYWQRAYYCPITFPKNPLTRYATAWLTISGESGVNTRWAICTGASPIPRDDQNTRICSGNASFITFELTGIPLLDREYETIDIYVRGDVPATAISGFGRTNGTINEVKTGQELSVALEAWLTKDTPNSPVGRPGYSLVTDTTTPAWSGFNAATTAASRVAMFIYAAGTGATTPIPLTSPRRVVGQDGSDTLVVTPGFTGGEKRLITGADYYLRQLSTYVIADIAVYGEDL